MNKLKENNTLLIRNISAISRIRHPSFYYQANIYQELLEICLECNIGTKMKQIIILYVLCDLMHTELTPQVQKHILKLINAYCSTTFTIMSTQLDSVLSVPWSSSSTSIVSVGNDTQDPNNSSCLFDLVNGLYLIDARIPEKAFKYLRATDLNYLEFYEKYFILYNSMSMKDYKIASQYLWLFQKLNTSSIATASNELTGPVSASNETKVDANNFENELGLFKLISKSNNLNDLNELNKLKHEQKMHSRLIITIHLANSLINEAYYLIKSHLKNIKLVLKTPSLANNPGVKLSKELVIHFFLQVDKFNLWKQVKKLTSLDNDLLLLMFNYLESSHDLNSVCMAIDMHVNNRSYKRAIELYDKHSKQIATSNQHSYLTSMIEIARELNAEYSNLEDDQSLNRQYSLITSQDIKDVTNFQYKFTVAIKDLCKNSKRCINLLNLEEDQSYISLLKIPSPENDAKQASSNNRQVTFAPSCVLDTSITREISGLSRCLTPVVQQHQTATKSILTNSKKRKPSTPHPNSAGVKFYNLSNELSRQKEEEEDDDQTDDTISMASDQDENLVSPSKKRELSPKSSAAKPVSEKRDRVLTSSLRISRSSISNVGKSVKFSAVKYTRNICVDDVKVDLEEHLELDDTSEKEKEGAYVERKLVFQDEETEPSETINNVPSSELNKTQGSLQDKLDDEKQIIENKKQESPKSIVYNDDEVVDSSPKSSQNSNTKTQITSDQIMSSESEALLSQNSPIKVTETVHQVQDSPSNKEATIISAIVGQESSISTLVTSPIKNFVNAVHNRFRTSLSPKNDTRVSLSPKIVTNSDISPKDGSRTSISPKNDTNILENKELSPKRSDTETEMLHVDSSNSPKASISSTSPIKTISSENTEKLNENKSFEKSPDKICESTNSSQSRSPLTYKTAPEVTNVSPQSRRSFFSLLGFNLTPHNSKTEKINDEQNTDNQKSTKKLTEASNVSVSVRKSSIVITPREKSPSKTPSPLPKSSTVKEFDTADPEHDNELEEAHISPIKSSAENKNDATTTDNDGPVCSFQIQYLTEDELIKQEKENKVDEDSQYNLLDSLKGRKSTIRYTQLESIDDGHRADALPVTSEVLTTTKDDNQKNQQEINETEDMDRNDDLNRTLESENGVEQTQVNNNASQNESFELNMSSISQNSEKATNKDDQRDSPMASKGCCYEDDNHFQLPEDTAPRLSRTNSESSLFSQISSVSEHCEKLKKQEEAAKKTKEAEQNVLKRGIPVVVLRHMDDNELKRARDEVAKSAEVAKKSGKGNLFRRRSDLSSSSGSSLVSGANYQDVVAKMTENIPSSFGSSDQEVRVTRSKLKALLEKPPPPVPPKSVAEPEVISKPNATGAKLNRRNSKKQPTQSLEQVNENEELKTTSASATSSVKMSISNLKKHNAAMEKLSEDSGEDLDGRKKSTQQNKSSDARVTRSMTRSPSPTASSIVSASVVSVRSLSTSTVASSTAAGSTASKRRGRPPKATAAAAASSTTAKLASPQEEGEEEEEHDVLAQHDKTLKADEQQQSSDIVELEISPTNSQVSKVSSICSVASSSASQSQRVTRKTAASAKSKISLMASLSQQPVASVTRSYSLRSKETKNKDDDSSSVHSELLNQSLEDVSESKSNAKKTRPRTRKSLGHLAYERGQQNDDANDDASSVCSSVCSELLENKEEDVPLAKKTRSRTSRKSLGPAVDKESAVKAKTTRSGSVDHDNKFSFSNPHNLHYGTSKSSKRHGNNAGFEFSPPSPIKK